MQVLVKSVAMIFEAIVRKFVPETHKSVAGDVVLITGAGHGLGRELANRFAKLNAKVVLWDINKDNVENVAAEIRTDGGIAYAYCCDISSEKAVESLSLRVVREVGDVTILVNNAGILHCQPIMCLNSQQIKRTFEVNLLSHFWTIRQFLPRMLELGKGHIVAISSAASLTGTVNMTDYCASKFGIRGLMEALSEELYSMNKEKVIHTTTICPLTFKTGMAKRPKTRFPGVLPIMELSDVANATMDAILRNLDLQVVPARVGAMLAFRGLFPKNVCQLVQRFVDYESQAHSP